MKMFLSTLAAIFTLFLSAQVNAQALPAGCASSVGYSPTTGMKCVVMPVSAQTQFRSTLDHWNSVEETKVAATQGPRHYYEPYFKDATYNKKLKENEELYQLETDYIFREEVPERMGGIQYVLGKKGNWVIRDANTKEILRDARCGNKIHEFMPFPSPEPTLNVAVAQNPQPAAQPTVVVVTSPPVTIINNNNNGQPPQVIYGNQQYQGYQSRPLFGLSFGIGIGFDDYYGGDCNGFGNCNRAGNNYIYGQQGRSGRVTTLPPQGRPGRVTTR